MGRLQDGMRGLFRRGLQLMLVGMLTGLFVGVFVTFYNVAARFAEHLSLGLYAAVRLNPALIPLLAAVLIGCAFIIGVVVRLWPMLQGSGVPQIEGASRGIFHFTWWKILVGKTAISLFCILTGMTVGAEGPSLQLGGALGQGVARMLGRSAMEQRYQITGGASAGIAVAFNAPLTGLIFAVEEAHRRFTPDIFIGAFASVLTAVVTRNALYLLLDMEITTALTSFAFATELAWTEYGFVLLTAVACGLAGVVLYATAFAVRKLVHRVKWMKGAAKMVVPIVLTGVFGLLTPYALGGGHGLLTALGTNGGARPMEIVGMLGLPVVVTLALVVVMRLITTSFHLGTSVPAGLFIPFLAIGACLGAVLSAACRRMGMDAAHADLIVMIGMSSLFAAVVKAPFTAIVMVMELTGSFTPLLPVVLGVSIGYLMSSLFGCKPIYDALLEAQLEEEPHRTAKQTVRVVVEERSAVDGMMIRDVLWPGSVMVETIVRGGDTIVAHSETVLRSGDELTVHGMYETEEELAAEIGEIVGHRRRRQQKKKQGGNP